MVELTASEQRADGYKNWKGLIDLPMADAARAFGCVRVPHPHTVWASAPAYFRGCGGATLMS
jgi:hypothetical protein